MNAFQNDPLKTAKFTQFALKEMEPAEAAAYRDQLLKEGASEEQIDREITQVRQFQSRMAEEFEKDERLRADPKIREGLFNQTKPPMLRFFGRWQAAFLFVIVGSVAVYNLKETVEKKLTIKEKVFGNAESFSDQLGNLSEGEPAEIQIAKPVAPTRSHQKKELKQIGISGSAPKAKFAKRKSRAFGIKGGALNSPAVSMDQVSGLVMDQESSFIPSPQPLPGKKRDEFNREGYEKIETNKYTLVSAQPLSTFSIDVDTAAYANVRRFLFKGQLPPKNAVRVEEMINYFPYDYDIKHDKHPVGIKVSQAVSPFNKERKIVRVAMKSAAPREMTEARKNLVFLLDVSGSMNDPKKLPLLKESMKLLMRKLKEKDSLSIVVYAGSSGVVLPPTPATEKLKIIKALDNLNAGGSTNGGAGIHAAYKMAKQAFIKNGVNRIILATDGDFNVGASSHGALLDLIEEKAKDDIFLTVVGLGMGNYQDSLLEKISNRGNGNFAYIDSLNEANKLFNIDLEKNLTTVAKDVKIQVEFNPNLVQAYRLIGYENRMLKAQDFNDDKKDAGEMGAGHTVTAIYEIVGNEEKLNLPGVDKLKYGKVVKNGSNDKELLNVKVRYKQPTASKSVKFEVPLQNDQMTDLKKDQEFDFAMAVATFGLKLRGDNLVDGITYRDLIKQAKRSKGKDEYGFRSELVEMVELARQIDK
ncbi:MAG: VWA domain-containing protein [Halobacteriovoraceae bacterium]|nr:VWA domain-containing protein [Halobacteriovoraceae bacterium]